MEQEPHALDLFFRTAEGPVALVAEDLKVLRASTAFADLVARAGSPMPLSSEPALGEALARFEGRRELEAAVRETARTGIPTAVPIVEGRSWLAHVRPLGEGRSVLISVDAVEAAARVHRDELAVERGRRAAAEHELAIQALLDRIDAALETAPLDPAARATALAQRTVPDLGDLAIVLLADSVQDLACRGVAHADPERQRVLDRSLGSWSRRFDPTSPLDCLLAAGQTTWGDGSDVPLPLDRLAGEPIASWVLAPLGRGERLLGALLIAHAESGRRHQPEHRQLAARIAARAGASIQSASFFDELGRGIRRRDELLSMVGHDVRSPLGAIQMRARMVSEGLARGSMDVAKATDMLQGIVRSVHAATALLDDVLDVTRLDVDVNLAPEDLDLGAVVREQVERTFVSTPEVAVAVELPVTPVLGRWDRSRLGQVLTNLLSNAIKYGRGRPVAVRVDVDEDLARVSVTDSGAGIPEADQRRVFERFTRVSGSEGQRGHGLGLWIAQRLARSMGGQITLESRAGVGSTFTLVLARTPEQGSSLAPEVEPAPAGAARVLIVEDDPHLRDALVALYQADGWEVEAADDGLRGLEAMRGRHPDVVVLDLQLPGLDGLSVFATMRAEPALASIPVIISSSDPMRAPEGTVRLRKPVDPAQILAITRRLCAR